MDFNFSNRIHNMGASELGDFLKLSENNNLISFAGGFPAPELFPSKGLTEITYKVLNEYSSISLQYGATEGYTPLREITAQSRMPRVGVECTTKNILITSGAQQGLDFSGKLFINNGDTIICESPTYLGALSAFRAYEPNILQCPMESDGMDINILEYLLKKNKNVKFIYTIPDFQNPTGITMSIEKRKNIAFLASKYKVPIIEDGPYSELSFEDFIYPSIKSFDKEGYVIYLGTFSKIFCPGLRIGWVCAEEDIIKKLILCKQGADLQPSTFNQLLIYEYLKNYNINSHINNLRSVYKNRRDAMLKAISTYLPEYITATHPKGGLFTWIEVSKNYTSKEFYKRALEENVAFVIGDAFFAFEDDHNHLRANYSCMNEDQIFQGIKRLRKFL
ncbi:PLP-dependent aminotransferase family protein [Hathewaya massiliensis]|uniref:aminotransferase-like domain-containing protein n=1 Tax=Hathewaya massiliensis TaxID=1964382 RepID=UPI001157B564|nr:PLP-dependent aminotransferase family protein [Hathewaya massiliensis]